MIFYLLFFLPIVLSYQNILHISDIHYDSSYYIGSPNQCYIGSSIGTGCCRKYSIGKGNYNEASKWGDLNCDVPMLLIDSTFNWIKNNNLEIDMIIYTGDSVDHHDITQSIDNNLNEIKMIYNLFDSHFHDIPMYSSVGNHDTYPIDQTLPDLYKYMIGQLSSYWTKWLTNSSKIMEEYGYYSHSINSKLQLVSFNSIYYDSHNLFKIDSEEKDNNSGNQMEWLEKEFQLANHTNKKIIFINHIPIFGSESTSYYNDRLANILNAYNQTLLIQLNGHEHSDHFYLYRKNNQVTHHASIPNSLVTSQNFPGFRIMQYDPINNNLNNYQQYICNLTKIIDTNQYTCEVLYDFKEFYGVSDMSLDSFKIVFNKLNSNITLLNKYLEFKNYGQKNIEKCENKSCVAEKLNQILYDF